MTMACSGLIQKHGVCIRILGDVTLLPMDVQAAIAKCVNLSRHNTRYRQQVYSLYLFHGLVQSDSQRLFCVHVTGRDCSRRT